MATPPVSGAMALLIVAEPEVPILDIVLALKENPAGADARRAVESAVEEISEILETFGGRRLQGGLDTLGSLALETTPAGIKALAERPDVKAILEDQPVSLISR